MDEQQPWGESVLVEFDEGIAWVSLNRPDKRNAMNPALNDEMIRVLDALEGDERCKLALDMFRYQIAKYIGSYIVALGGVDAIVFTAGIGENNSGHRAAICEYLEFLGLKIDPEKNSQRGKELDFATADSKIRALLIPTNEELMIAQDTVEIIG